MSHHLILDICFWAAILYHLPWRSNSYMVIGLCDFNPTFPQMSISVTRCLSEIWKAQFLVLWEMLLISSSTCWVFFDSKTAVSKSVISYCPYLSFLRHVSQTAMLHEWLQVFSSSSSSSIHSLLNKPTKCPWVPWFSCLGRNTNVIPEGKCMESEERCMESIERKLAVFQRLIYPYNTLWNTSYPILRLRKCAH